jgi:hypothetical protein
MYYNMNIFNAAEAAKAYVLKITPSNIVTKTYNVIVNDEGVCLSVPDNKVDDFKSYYVFRCICRNGEVEIKVL